MGKRVHVVKIHEKYGSYETFNWQWSEFHLFLNMLGCDVSGEDEYVDRFDCEVCLFKEALEALKEYKKKGIKSKKMQALMNENGFDNEELDESLEEIGGIDHVIEAMKEFYKESDRKSRYIEFVAW